MLFSIARELDFGSFLLLSQGMQKETEKARQGILATSFEAFIGALYLDQGHGYKVYQDFLKKYLVPKLPDILDNHDFIDAKSRFQEFALKKEKSTPHYKVLKHWGPDHAKQFISGVFLGDKLIAEGEGRSKQEAEKAAAKNGLKAMGWK